MMINNMLIMLGGRGFRMSHDKALERYDVSQFRTPDGYTSDIAVFTIVSENAGPYKPAKMTLKLLLIKRSLVNAEGEPNIEAGKWALPGGFVDEAESGLDAASRELAEETGVSELHMKHFGVYDTPGRDPRGWIISNAHYAVVPESYLATRRASDDAIEVELFPVEKVLELALAFDHKQIISDAIRFIKRDLLETTVARQFLQKHFTYSELQTLLLTVTDDPAIKSAASFARKIKRLPFIEEVVNQKTQRTSKSPAQLYRFNDVEIIRSIYSNKI